MAVALLKGFPTDCYMSHIYDDYGRLDRDSILNNSKRTLSDPVHEILHRYIIGKSLVYWLKVMGLEEDSASTGLADAVNEHLDLLLLASYPKKLIVIAMYVTKKIRQLIQKWNEKEPISTLRSNLSPESVEGLDGEKAFWMSVQSLSYPLVEEVHRLALNPLDKLIKEHIETN